MTYVRDLWPSGDFDHIVKLGWYIILGKFLKAVIEEVFRIGEVIDVVIFSGVLVATVVAEPDIVASTS